MAQGNGKGNNRHGLTASGVQTDEADYRLHVCFRAMQVFLYQTAYGVRTIRRGTYQLQEARRHDGTVTATGYLVPPWDIPGIKCPYIPAPIWQQFPIDKGWGYSQLGRQAEAFAKHVFELGYIPLDTNVERVLDAATQLKGIDLVVTTVKTIQVKCDEPGGDKDRGGTGYLFLQVAERNIDGEY